jgi:hypothetical protein
VNASPSGSRHVTVALAMMVGLSCRRPPTSGDSTTPLTPPPAFCDGIARDNEAALKALPPTETAAGLQSALRQALTCTVTPGGGWGIAVGALADEGGELWGRWTLVHAAQQTRATFTPDTTATFGGGGPERQASRKNLTWSTDRRIVPTAPTFIDFDGDGEPEAIVVVETTETSESGRSFSVRRGRVWTAGTAGIELYAPARNFALEAVEDVDHDGHPDLISRGPYAAFARLACGDEEPYPVSGPPLLAHGVSRGEFSWSDAAASDFARKGCPSLPDPVLVAGKKNAPKGPVDFAASARNLACARLWGATAAQLTAAVARRCAPAPSSPCPRCDDRALLESWARLPAPLSLSRPPGHQ